MNRWLMTLLLLLLGACVRDATPLRMRSSYMAAPPPPPLPVMVEPMMASPPPLTAIAGFSRRMVLHTPTLSRPTPARTATRSSATPSSAQAQPVPGEGSADDGIEQGVAAFVKPPPMIVDHWYVVEFAASPSEAKLHEETEGQQLTASTNVYVAPMMRVTLLDNPAFQIKPKGAAEQPTGLDKTATWLWDVMPKSTDASKLEAKVEVLRKRADGSFETIESYTRKVDVTVRVAGLKRTLAVIDDASTLGSKLTGLFGTWQKTIAALVALIGALGLLAWKLGLRKSKPE